MSEANRVRFDGFEFDSSTGELTRRDRKIRLQDQPAKLLSLLASRPGELVTRLEIQKALWGDDRFVEFEHAINTAIKKIREALEDDPAKPRIIETIPRKGYRFIAGVERPAAPVITATTSDDVPPSEISLSAEMARKLFVTIQFGYLAMYTAALYYLNALEEGILRPVIITAMCGIAVRLYLVSSVGFAHPAAGRKFRWLFPVVLILDGLWAAAPLLAVRRIGFGIALIGAAGLAYLPFSQRTLIRTIYGVRK